MRALVLGLVVAVLGGGAVAQPSVSDIQAWVAKPQVDFAKLGVTYWRVEEPWADPDTVVTIDSRNIDYSATCETAGFPYEQDWKSEGQLEVFPIWLSMSRCQGKPSDAFLRFYYLLRQSDSAKSSAGLVAVGQSMQIDPYIRLRRFEPQGLEFRRWVIAEYFNGNHLAAPDLSSPDYAHPSVPPVGMPPPPIVFDHGQLEGSPSCGALMGNYTLAGQSLVMHPSFLLAGFCPENLMRQNDSVLAALRRVRRFDRDGQQAILRGDNGETEVVLSPA